MGDRSKNAILFACMIVGFASIVWSLLAWFDYGAERWPDFTGATSLFALLLAVALIFVWRWIVGYVLGERGFWSGGSQFTGDSK